MEAEVQLLRLNKIVVHTYLRSDHFKKCLRGEYLAEEKSAPPKPESWNNLVRLTQYM